MFLILKSSARNRWLNNEHVYSRGIAPAQKSVVLPPPAPASWLAESISCCFYRVRVVVSKLHSNMAEHFVCFVVELIKVLIYQSMRLRLIKLSTL